MSKSVEVEVQGLSEFLAVELDQAQEEVQMWIEKFIRERKPERKEPTSTTCMARIWGGGKGLQCSKRRCDGSEFCKSHLRATGKTCKGCGVVHASSWMHLGRVDEDPANLLGDEGWAKDMLWLKPKDAVPDEPADDEYEIVGKVAETEAEVVAAVKARAEAVSPTPGTDLYEVQFEDATYMWNDKTGDLYDMEIYEESGKLHQVGNYLESEDEDDDE